MDFASGFCPSLAWCRVSLRAGHWAIWPAVQMICPPGAHFSNVPKSFHTRKPIAKSRTLRLQSCFICVFLTQSEVLFIQEVSGVYTSPLFDTDKLKNGFTGPRSFRGFWETSPWFDHPEESFSYKEAQFKKFCSACEKTGALLLKMLMKHPQRRKSEGQIPLVQGYQTLLFCTLLLLLSFSFHTLVVSLTS